MLLNSLVQAYREPLCPTVVAALETVSSRCPVGAVPPHSPDDEIPGPVLEKEAVYQAVALGAYELFDHIDFSNWLHSTLLKVCSRTDQMVVTLAKSEVPCTSFTASCTAQGSISSL